MPRSHVSFVKFSELHPGQLFSLPDEIGHGDSSIPIYRKTDARKSNEGRNDGVGETLYRHQKTFIDVDMDRQVMKIEL